MKAGRQNQTATSERGIGPGAERLHAALIMDGNGRWAKQRFLPRTMGHQAGVAALRRTVEGAQDLGLACLTVFGFSTENWQRPAAEVAELMRLLQMYFESDIERLVSQGVRVRILGSREGLEPAVLKVVNAAEQRTVGNSAFLLQVAFNYGSRTDLARAAREIAQDALAGRIDPAEIDEAFLAQRLVTADSPPVDFIVRTSGERRLSNFLLWESAYAELIFQDVLWPDYGPSHLKAAIDEFRGRERRFGSVASDDALAAG